MLVMSISNAKSFIDCADKFVKKTIAAGETGEYKGGHFCIADIETGTPLLTILLGTRENDTPTKVAVEEKCIRLGMHPEHVSSWQSRDHMTKKRAGSIRAKNYIFGFAGFPELWDEAVCLSVALEMGEIDTQIAEEIALKSTNSHLNKIV